MDLIAFVFIENQAPLVCAFFGENNENISISVEHTGIRSMRFQQISVFQNIQAIKISKSKSTS